MKKSASHERRNLFLIVGVYDVMFSFVGDGITVEGIADEFSGVGKELFGGVVISSTSSLRNGLCKGCKGWLRIVLYDLVYFGDNETVFKIPSQEFGE